MDLAPDVTIIIDNRVLQCPRCKSLECATPDGDYVKGCTFNIKAYAVQDKNYVDWHKCFVCKEAGEPAHYFNNDGEFSR